MKYLSLALLLIATTASASGARMFKIQNDDGNPTGVIKLYTKQLSTMEDMKADLVDWGGIGIMKPGYPASLTSEGIVDIAYQQDGCHVYLVPTSTAGTYNYCFCGTEDTDEWPACRGRLAVEQTK